MPRKAFNFQNTVIYKIRCEDPSVTDVYVGSTTNFVQRKCQHKSGCNNPKGKKYNQKIYNIIRENGGWENWKMIQIEEFPCTNKRESERREEEWRVKLNANMNTIRCWIDGKCSIEGCDNYIFNNGLCVKHGAKVNRCRFEGCENRAQNNGVCVKHGAQVKRCRIDGCENGARNNGVCVKHGAQVKRCRIDGCENNSLKGGVCIKHGAEKGKRCRFDGCENRARNNGVCTKHSPKYKCECGVTLSLLSKKQHEKSKKHLRYKNL